MKGVEKYLPNHQGDGVCGGVCGIFGEGLYFLRVRISSCPLPPKKKPYADIL